jgi:tyrosinase
VLQRRSLPFLSSLLSLVKVAIMRAGFISLLALNAAGVLAAPQATTIDSSAPEVTNIDELADLAASAYETAQELAGDKTKRASTCNWSNVRVRREW